MRKPFDVEAKALDAIAVSLWKHTGCKDHKPMAKATVSHRRIVQALRAAWRRGARWQGGSRG